MARKRSFFSRMPTKSSSLFSQGVSALENGWAPCYTASPVGPPKHVILPPIMRPRGGLDDGTPVLSTKFYHPANLLYRVAHFGDLRAFEAACVCGRTQGVCFPDLAWETFFSLLS